jgi:hypothetical protein
MCFYLFLTLASIKKKGHMDWFTVRSHDSSPYTILDRSYGYDQENEDFYVPTQFLLCIYQTDTEIVCTAWNDGVFTVLFCGHWFISLDWTIRILDEGSEHDAKENLIGIKKILVKKHC